MDVTVASVVGLNVLAILGYFVAFDRRLTRLEVKLDILTEICPECRALRSKASAKDE